MDVRLVLPQPGPLEDRIPDVGVVVSHQRHTRWVVPPGRRWRELRAAPRLHRAAVRSLRQTRPDVVLTNTLTVPGAALAARAAGIPHVWRIVEFARREHPLPFALPVGVAYRLVNRLSRAVIVPSHALADEAGRYVPESRLHVVPMAVDLYVEPRPQPDGPPASIRRLVVIGRLSPVKRTEDALEALKLLVDSGVDLRLSVIGASEQEEGGRRFKSRARDLGVAERVELHGELPNPWEGIGDDTIFVNCSGDEGLSRVTIEAMKHSIPVVASDGRGVAELVQHGETGLLFPVGRAPALADRVAQLCRDSGLRRDVVRAAYTWASDRFTREEQAAAVAEILYDAKSGRR